MLLDHFPAQPIVERIDTPPIRVAAYVGTALGVAGAVTGVVLIGVGAGTGSGTTNPSTGYVLADRVDDFARARTLQTAGGVALSAGLAVAAIGVIILMMPGDSNVGVAPTAGGAVVSFGGRFP